MFPVSDLLRIRHRRGGRANRRPVSRLARLAWGLTAVFSLSLALAAVGLAAAYTSLTSDLPSLHALPLLLEPPGGFLRTPSKLYDRTGERAILALENPAATARKYLPLAPSAPEHLPDPLIRATLTLADPEFWTHPGYSFPIPASYAPVTLAERLVTGLLLWDEPPGLRQALRARLLAAQITRHYGREKILEWYLNTANYGQWAFGADAAAWAYFGHSASRLTLAEAALLAAVSEAPALNPVDTPGAALERMRLTLDQMQAQGLISPEQAAEAEPPHLQTTPAQIALSQNPSAAFASLALAQLDAYLPRARLELGGLRVITTLDAGLQDQVECAAKTQLGRLTGGDQPACAAARLLPTLLAGAQAPAPGLTAQAAVLDPRTGQVLALLGLDEAGNALSRLENPAPGTLLTPYIYLSAFTRGFGPASLVWDIPAKQLPSLPQNPNPDERYHGPVRMRTALANDYLVPALDLLNQLGPENVWQTARRVGLPSLDVPAGSAAQQLVLHGGQVPLLEMVQAYGVFSTQGVWIGLPAPASAANPAAPLLPVAILRVEDLAGEIWAQPGPPQSRPVMSAQLAYLITHVLSDEAARWPGLGHPNALEIGRPAGARLGQAEGGTSTWAVGFTPQFAVGVWVGYPSPSGEPAEGGAALSPNVAAGIWHAVLQYAGRDLPPEGWAAPPGINAIEVCDPSGMLPTFDCPAIVTEVFLPGSEPAHADTLYRRFQINRETGLLATVFTPPNLIDERVYLVIPPEARAWAQAAGLPLPPEGYDLVSGPGAAVPGVELNAPQMFAYVRGEVRILGSAAGAGFASYRVQVGPGLNPQQWVEVAGGNTPVEAGALAEWDTTGLEGLYAIRLLVVDREQRIQTAILQVTVDNTPPTAAILSPAEGQQLRYPAVAPVTLQFSAADDLAVARVEVYMDNQPLATLTQPPYALPWDVRPGEHTLRVRVFDLAGNEAEAVLEFVVSR